MGRFVAMVLAAVLAGGGVAQAKEAKRAGGSGSWDAMATLKPGTQIDVLAADEAGPEACLVSAVDDGALTCLKEDPANDTRLVFPRSAVREVRMWEVAPERHVGRWILAGVVLGVGVALMVEGNIVGIAVYGVFLGTAEIMQMGPFRTPPRSPAPKRMRRRLVYRGATP